jgi:hypothetical protein
MVGRTDEMGEGPHGHRHGWLKNGNPPGDFLSAPRSGAKNRRGLPWCIARASMRSLGPHVGCGDGVRLLAKNVRGSQCDGGAKSIHGPEWTYSWFLNSYVGCINRVGA